MKHQSLSHHIRLAGLWMIAVLVSLAACTILTPIPDHSRYFLLTPIATAQNAIDQNDTSGLVLGLGPIKFPQYLERSEIATRIAPNQVRFLNDDHWAEPLKDNFTHVLSQNLTTLLGTQQIIQFPWYSSTHVDYQIAITVDRFECGTDGESGLAARWSIDNPVDGHILQGRHSDLKASCGADTDQGVAALSQALGDLSRQIAEAIAQLAARRHQG